MCIRDSILCFPVSTPNVSITVPPGPLYAGITSLTLTCTISLNPATDIMLISNNVDITWLKEDAMTELSNNDDTRVTISLPSGSQLSFTSTLTLFPLSTFDNTSFTCRANVHSDMFLVIRSEISSHTIPIIIQSKLPVITVIPVSYTHLTLPTIYSV